MDTLSDSALPVKSTVKRRRQHTPDFRAKVVNLCQQPGVSVAAIALDHNLNANLVRRWIREAGKAAKPSAPGFMPLPLNTPPNDALTVRIEIGKVSIHWPIAHINQAVPWLKALQS
jgi:transposase-like protein